MFFRATLLSGKNLVIFFSNAIVKVSKLLPICVIYCIIYCSAEEVLHAQYCKMLYVIVVKKKKKYLKKICGRLSDR
jgi:hypothetical protein